MEALHTLTAERIEEARSDYVSFAKDELGVVPDGGPAALEQATVEQREDLAKSLLTARPKDPHNFNGYYDVLDNRNWTDFGLVTAALVDYYVLIPAGTSSGSVFLKAVVSSDSLQSGALRLHVLPWEHKAKEPILPGSNMALSAAAKLELPGMGDHSRVDPNKGEGEHMPRLLVAGLDPRKLEAWRAGVHDNHTLRNQPNTSVMASSSSEIFGPRSAPMPLTITQEQVRLGQRVILWEQSMVDELGQPLTAASSPDALVSWQGVLYSEVRDKHPQAIDAVKEVVLG